MVWTPWRPRPAPSPTPSPRAGDSSNIERGSTPAPNPVRSGPQRPGEGFTSGGGSAPISSGTTVGGTTGGSTGGTGSGGSGGKGGGGKGGSGGKGGGNSTPTQIGSISVTEKEAQALGKVNIPTTVVSGTNTMKTASDILKGIGTKTYTSGSYIGGGGSSYGDSGISGAPMQPTIADKIKYQYEKFDINVAKGYLPSGITPAQLNARNSAQSNAQSYQTTYEQFRNADTQTIVGAIAPSYKSFLGQDKTNKNALQDLLTEKITKRFEETKKNELQQGIDNRIKDAQNNLNSNFNDLQARVNEGTLSVTDAENAYQKLAEQEQKKLESSVTELEKNWYDTRGRYIVASDTKLLSDVNFAKSLDKSLGAKSLAKTAVISAGVVASGGLASAGLFGSAVATATPAVMTGLGLVAGGAVAYQGVTTTQNLLELEKQGLLTKTAVIANIAPQLTHLIVGVGSGLATGVAISPARNALINKEANKFNKEILKSEKLQQEYWTPENIKQGYFIKKVNGVDVKFTTPTQRQVNALEVAKATKGLPRIEKMESAGTLTERNNILGYLQKDANARVLLKKEGIVTDTAEVGKIFRKNNYGKLEEWNYIRQASMVDKSGNSLAVAFKVTSTGKVVGTRVTRIDVIEGKAVGGFFRPAYPSERQITKVPVKGGNDLEVFKTGELKLLGKVKQVSQEKVIGVKQEGDRLTTLVEQKSALIKIGRGGGKTKTFAELSNLANKETSLFAINKPKLLARGTTQIKTTKESGKGLFATRGVIETNLPKPTKLLNLKVEKVFSKFMKRLSEPPKPSTDILVKPVKTFLPEITPSKANGGQSMLPSSIEIGGTGQGSSIYGEGYKANLPKVALGNKLYSVDLAPQSTMDYTGLIGLNLPKLRAPIIRTTTFTQRTTYLPPIRNLLFNRQIMETTKISSDFLKGKGILLPAQESLIQNTFKAKVGSESIVRRGTTTSVGFRQPQVQIEIPRVIEQPILKPILPIPLKPFKPQPLILKEPYFTPFFGLPNLGEIQTGGGQRARETGVGLFGKTKYTASLGSVLLKAPKKQVTAEEYALLSKQKYLGLGLRPEIEIVSKKKKKRTGLF